MEKELKSCTGVLLRADLTGHGHPTLYGRNWLNWPCPVRSALKRTPVQDFNSSSCSTTWLEPHIKKLETYIALFIFLVICRMCSAQWCKAKKNQNLPEVWCSQLLFWVDLCTMPIWFHKFKLENSRLELGIWNSGCQSLVNPQNPRVQQCNTTLCSKIAKISGCQTLLSKNSAGATEKVKFWWFLNRHDQVTASFL